MSHFGLTWKCLSKHFEPKPDKTSKHGIKGPPFHWWVLNVASVTCKIMQVTKSATLVSFHHYVCCRTPHWLDIRFAFPDCFCVSVFCSSYSLCGQVTWWAHLEPYSGDRRIWFLDYEKSCLGEKSGLVDVDDRSTDESFRTYIARICNQSQQKFRVTSLQEFQVFSEWTFLSSWFLPFLSRPYNPSKSLVILSLQFAVNIAKLASLSWSVSPKGHMSCREKQLEQCGEL